MRSLLLLSLAIGAAHGQQALRPLTLDDMHKFKDVADPRCAPAGDWVAYTVSTVDAAADKRDTDIWMSSADGKEHIRVTSSPEAENSPRFSPDGRYLAFLSSRPGPAKNKGIQIWLLDRKGGEAQQITDTKARISAIEWAPDSKRLAVVLREPEDDEKDASAPRAGEPDKPKVLVIDRYSFKRDGAGYLTQKKRNRIHLFAIESRKFELLTNTDFDESNPVFSPDGKALAFVSNHAPDWDRVPSSDIFVVDAVPNSKPRRLTSFDGQDSSPFFSPDGLSIAYLKGSDHKLGEYNMTQLALIPTAGGTPKILTAAFDRGVTSPRFTADGRFVEFLAADDMSSYIARVPASGGAVERVLPGQLAASALHHAGSCAALIVSTDKTPGEVHLFGPAGLKKITSHNNALMSTLLLANTEEIRYKTADGNEPHGLLTYPLNYEAGKKYPLLLRIHGGPNGQDQHAFNFERQLFAAHGYAVLNINYRGSSGRGQQYTVSIANDWGNKEVVDLLAGVDHVVARGIADPDRLGLGGWSYGGILTNYLIASTTRFKAGTSGAGVSFPLAFYGHDQYIRQYDNEIGPPWKAGLDPWIKISYPFLHADRIKTPTLFLCGDKDFNVPLLGSEQMYQALKNNNVETQLIIYPGENHGISRPSFRRDVMQRYLDWYARFLKPSPQGAASSAP
jgi:dipeptidyl aminopeptidase/acylaminoacyl peptidase